MEQDKKYFYSLSFRSAMFRIFKILKVALIRAKTPTFSTNIVGAGFTQIVQKTKTFLRDEISENTDVGFFILFLLSMPTPVVYLEKLLR